MIPLFHLSGTFFRLQIVFVSSFSLSVVNSRSAFSSSAVIISSPGALPFLRLFITLLISALFTGPVSMSAVSCSCVLQSFKLEGFSSWKFNTQKLLFCNSKFSSLYQDSNARSTSKKTRESSYSSTICRHLFKLAAKSTDKDVEV